MLVPMPELCQNANMFTSYRIKPEHLDTASPDHVVVLMPGVEAKVYLKVA